MHDWQAGQYKGTYAPPVKIRVIPKMKNYPIGGWIFIGAGK